MLFCTSNDLYQKQRETGQNTENQRKIVCGQPIVCHGKKRVLFAGTRILLVFCSLYHSQIQAEGERLLAVLFPGYVFSGGRPGGHRSFGSFLGFDIPEDGFLMAENTAGLVIKILNENLRFQVHLVVVLGPAAILFLLPVLAHHDQRRLNGGYAGEHQVQ